MKIIKLIPGIIWLLLSGCSGTTVVLVPDDGGNVGKVLLETQAGSQTLTQANESSEASKADKPPEKSKILSKEEIRSKFSEVLASQPASPEHKSLHGFASGSADISPYQKEINEIFDRINATKSCRIIIIGHADRVGTNADNQHISQTRANNVKQALITKGVAEKCIGETRFYGESDLFKWTEDNVGEALNRRVEVEIR